MGKEREREGKRKGRERKEREGEYQGMFHIDSCYAFIAGFKKKSISGTEITNLLSLYFLLIYP